MRGLSKTTVGLLMLWLAYAAPAHALGESRTEPLDVPRGLPMAALSSADETPRAGIERIESAADALKERGFSDLPGLAWAMLDVARRERMSTLVERAGALAPETPAVQFEVARELKSVPHLLRALAGVTKSLPGLVWLAGTGGAALGVALLAATAILVGLAFARTVAMNGHLLGHLIARQDPPSWPGVLVILAALALLPLAGAGPAILLAIAAVLTGPRLGRAQAIAPAVLLVVAGVLLGPGLDTWSRLGALSGRDPALIAAWRLENAQPMEGDHLRVARVVEARPDDLLLRLALGRAWLRAGDLTRADQLTRDLPDVADPWLLASVENLRGSVALARGDIDASVEAFEAARATRESPAVLYNLSQAHARAVRLAERASLFETARALDPDLISRYTQFDGTNVHRYLIQSPIPLSMYVRRAFEPSIESQAIVRTVRAWAFGPRSPSWAWMVLPLSGLLGVALQRRSIWLCGRCSRAICRRCDGVDEEAGGTCGRCARLFDRDGRSDPRLRKQLLEREKVRRRRTAGVLAGVALAAPGVPRLIEGRTMGGAVALVMLAVGWTFALSPNLLAAPIELGALGDWLWLAPSVVLIPLVYTFGLLDVREYLSRARARS
ncbi:MAG: hypothetical protein JRG76_06900 [Deltaproteobacteria bacterium]|nr:hypothetical protein [Deltaproteobacteria bacterium]MBW2414222.1 hypothetical protein [Deltaproteobacteria bacterium]